MSLRAPLNLNLFVLDEPSQEPFPKVHRPGQRRPRKRKLFFAPRVTMSWVEKAANLPGRAWHLACALLFEASLAKRRHNLRLSGSTRQRFGLESRTTIRRAVHSLQQEGLIRVTTKAGRLSVFSLLGGSVA